MEIAQDLELSFTASTAYVHSEGVGMVFLIAEIPPLPFTVSFPLSSLSIVKK